jgi:hypothetical protein
MRRAALLFALIAPIGCGDDTGSGGAGGSGSTTGPTSTGGTSTKASVSSSSFASSSSTGGAMTHCEELCAFFTELETTLMCAFDEPACVTDCEDSFAMLDPMCVDEAEGYNDCLMMEPPTSFQCSPEGGFAWAPRICMTEYDALVACVSG